MKNKTLTKWTLFCAVVCSLLTLTFTASSPAQSDIGEEVGKNEFQVWGGVSPDSTTSLFLGQTEDARFGIVGLRYARRFNNNKIVNLKYTADVIPAAILSFPDYRIVQTGANSYNFVRDRRNTYGAGIAPFGLQINFRPRKKVQPFIGSSGGFLYFKNRIPNESGTRFNFTADLSGGLEIRLKNQRAVTVGYKYYHISNGYRGLINPGFDNNLFYVGYSFFR